MDDVAYVQKLGYKFFLAALIFFILVMIPVLLDIFKIVEGLSDKPIFLAFAWVSVEGAAICVGAFIACRIIEIRADELKSERVD